MSVAVAVDLGASSIRSAAARLDRGRIHLEPIAQTTHEPRERNGKLEWDFDLLHSFAQEASRTAASLDATLGIDGWGVDIGFLTQDRRLAGPPVAYRDISHQRAFERLAAHRGELYRLTGVQHQPFNTIYQLAARRAEGEPLRDWLLIPDLLGFLLTGVDVCEASNASTTQLVGLDGNWCPQTFARVGWPVPQRKPEPPGRIVGRCGSGAPLALVATHDTASAVAGLGRLQSGDAFLNVGSWALLGTLVDTPIVTGLGEEHAFTNERAHDGRIRLLTNVPGMYVFHRLHQEVGDGLDFADWIEKATDWPPAVDLMGTRFFNPRRMSDAIAEGLEPPCDARGWAGLALASWTQTVATQIAVVEKLTKRPVTRIRISGGASKARRLMSMLADRLGRRVEHGVAEATLLGNAAVQFVAQGALPDWEAMADAVEASVAWQEVSA